MCRISSSDRSVRIGSGWTNVPGRCAPCAGLGSLPGGWPGVRRAGHPRLSGGADAGQSSKTQLGNRTRRTRQANADIHLFSVESGTRTTGVAGRLSATSTGPYSRRRALRLYFRAVRAIFGSLKVPNQAPDLGALGGTRTPNLLIRRFQYGRPAPFRSIRDLRLVSAGCPGGSRSSEGCSSVWLPAWLPAVRPAGTTNGFQERT